MAICDFCSDTLFEDASWLPRELRAHHRCFQAWEKSVEQSCTVCILLLEHLQEAVEAVQKKEDKYNVVNIRSTSTEDALLGWMRKRRISTEQPLPIYETSFQDAGGRNAWLLKFKPRSGTTHNGHTLSLPKQNFLVYSEEYDASSPDCPALDPRTDSDATFAQIFSWIETCRSHPLCEAVHSPASDAYLPTRLLSVGTLSSPHLQLVLTSTRPPAEFRPYITLSYAWGPEPHPHRLLETNYASYRESIPDAAPHLPQTIVDAIATTRRLGIRWLWVDALCIIQKSTPEWLREGPKMDEVYANAYLNLSASSSRTSHDGLFRTRRAAAVPPARTGVRWMGGGVGRVSTVVREDFWEREVLAQPLYKRGWVLQERLIAARVLHFTRHGVWWQCPEVTASERNPGGTGWEGGGEEGRWRELLHRRVKEGGRGKGEEDGGEGEDEGWGDQVEMQKLWRGVVENYTRCDLTDSNDKLMAMAGISRRVRMFFREGYVAGMWERALVEQLPWRVVEFRPPVWDPQYRAPSWAWPSVDGVVRVPARLRMKRDYTMTIKPGGEHLVWEDPENQVGRILFGSLTADAAVFRMRFEAGGKHDMIWSWARENGEASTGAWCQLFPDVPLDANALAATENGFTFRPSMVVGEPSYLVCSVIMLSYQRDWGHGGEQGSYAGYALAVKGVSAAFPNSFQRFGLIEFREFGWDDLHRVKMPEINLKGKEDSTPGSREFQKHTVTLL